MIANERLTKDFVRCTLDPEQFGTKDVDEVCRDALLEILPADNKETYKIKFFSTPTSYFEGEYVEIPSFALLGAGSDFQSQNEKQEFLVSDFFEGCKQKAENGDKFMEKFVQRMYEAVTKEDWQKYVLDLLPYENECDMTFKIQNLYTIPDEEGADLYVNLGRKKEALEEMTRQELAKLGYDEKAIESELQQGKFFALAVNSKNTSRDFEYTRAGLTIINPDRTGSLYLLRPNNELVCTGYFFNKAEHEQLVSFVQQAYERAVQKASEREYRRLKRLQGRV